MTKFKANKSQKASFGRSERMNSIPQHFVQLTQSYVAESCSILDSTSLTEGYHFDLCAPFGTYKIDRFESCFEGHGESSGLECIRREVERYASASAHRAFRELVKIAARRHKAERLLVALKKVQKEATPEAIAGLTLNGSKLEAFRLISSFELEKLSQLEVVQASPPNYDPFPKYFIKHLYLSWIGAVGKAPSLGLQSSFVQFLEAAWVDLGLRDPIDQNGKRTSLQDWLRDRAKQVAREVKRSKKRAQESSASDGD